MKYITELFDSFLRQSDSIDMAESDFKRMLVDDPDLKKEYKSWCRERDTTERDGFLEYSREYIERHSGGWDVFQAD